MSLFYHHSATDSVLRLIQHQAAFDCHFSEDQPITDRTEKLLTIAWNIGPEQEAIIDGVPLRFPSHSILPLMINQSFYFKQPTDIIAWQFNQEFYCLADHNREAGCIGFLFYSSANALWVQLDAEERRKFDGLLQGFIDEFETADNVQGDMLRTMLKRLIVKIVRVGKQQHEHLEISEDRLGVIWQFNLLVEQYYQREHQVQFYADRLNKSAKTLSNLFGLYNYRSPLQVIHQRVVMEAKRLFYYTEQSVKEVAHQVGFDDAAHFSRFFKRATGVSPSEFKHNVETNDRRLEFSPPPPKGGSLP